MRVLVHALAAVTLFAACGPKSEPNPNQGLVDPLTAPSGVDGQGVPGIPVSTDVSDTAAWTARNNWDDVDSNVDSQAAGMAWSASSGLNWDQKFSAWVKSLSKTPGDPASDVPYTYTLTTPWHTSFPAPALECAETAMFLRALFASWYALPFFMETKDQTGSRVFFGHFGVRTMTGKWANSTSYGKYTDYTTTWQPSTPWPSDSTLRARHLDSGTDGSADVQYEMPGSPKFGAYLDQILLNKRAGYFILTLLDYFYSGSLADTVNTYNLQVTAFREGDMVIRRWQRNGIGHTLVIKSITPEGSNQLEAEVIAGDIPRKQGNWSDDVEGKTELTSDDAGGVGLSEDSPSVPYWQLGGGLKRWRVTRNVNGAWTNTFMPGDDQFWISSSDGPDLSSRPMQLQTMLYELPPPQKRDSLLMQIAQLRTNLAASPSSCASRTEREDAFNQLYALAPLLNVTTQQMDNQYRTLDDYVFQPLDYSSSKTCCWDSSSASMYKVIMAYAKAEQSAANAQQMCVGPTVFAANAQAPSGYTGTNDGYQLWRNWAAQQGLSSQWVDSNGQPAVWKADEQCTQANVTADSTIQLQGLDWCQLDANAQLMSSGDMSSGAPPDAGSN